MSNGRSQPIAINVNNVKKKNHTSDSTSDFHVGNPENVSKVSYSKLVAEALRTFEGKKVMLQLNRDSYLKVMVTLQDLLNGFLQSQNAFYKADNIAEGKKESNESNESDDELQSCKTEEELNEEERRWYKSPSNIPLFSVAGESNEAKSWNKENQQADPQQADPSVSRTKFSF
jgi:hypothetical protein